jgi:hypothetical protein
MWEAGKGASAISLLVAAVLIGLTRPWQWASAESLAAMWARRAALKETAVKRVLAREIYPMLGHDVKPLKTEVRPGAGRWLAALMLKAPHLAAPRTVEKSRTFESCIEDWPDDIDAAGASFTVRHAEGWAASAPHVAPVLDAVVRHLGGQWSYQPDALHSRITFTRSAPAFVLPSRLDYVDTTGRVDLIPLGMRGDGKELIHDLGGESPHALIAAKTRKGKTSLLTLWAAHTASHGAAVMILDPKRVGFTKVFEGLRNVRVVTGPPDPAAAAAAMALAVGEFKTELERRYVAIENGTDESTLTPWLLILDEAGSLSMVLRKYGLDSAMDDLQWLLWRGGQARMHVVTATQQASVKVLGSSDVREQYDCKIALGSGVGKESAKMLFGDKPMPTVEDIRGRAVVEVDGDLLVAQLAYLAPDKAR